MSDVFTNYLSVIRLRRNIRASEKSLPGSIGRVTVSWWGILIISVSKFEEIFHLGGDLYIKTNRNKSTYKSLIDFSNQNNYLSLNQQRLKYVTVGIGSAD